MKSDRFINPFQIKGDRFIFKLFSIDDNYQTDIKLFEPRLLSWLLFIKDNRRWKLFSIAMQLPNLSKTPCLISLSIE